MFVCITRVYVRTHMIFSESVSHQLRLDPIGDLSIPAAFTVTQPTITVRGINAAKEETTYKDTTYQVDRRSSRDFIGMLYVCIHFMLLYYAVLIDDRRYTIMLVEVIDGANGKGQYY
jgi:hypothetical protein